MGQETPINKTFGKTHNSNSVNNPKQNAFFSNPRMFSIHKKVNPTEVLEFIKVNSPISIWDLSKKLNINRNTIYYLMRDLEFAGLIYSKLKINKSNHRVRMIYYNKKVKRENE